MNTPEDLLKSAPDIEKKIGYTYKNRQNLLLAFIHCSFVNEYSGLKEHNERLEFLGDSILGMLIADYLYKTLPDTPEGELSFLRSRLVEASSCIKYLEKLGIDSYLLLGRGEKLNIGRGRESIRADLFEAVIGSIYLDGGIESVKKFLFDHFLPEIQEIVKTPVHNWKALLQDWSQKNHQKTPLYKVVSQEGPEHKKFFKIVAVVNDQEMGWGEGNSKKEAEQKAAKDAFEKIST